MNGEDGRSSLHPTTTARWCQLLPETLESSWKQNPRPGSYKNTVEDPSLPCDRHNKTTTTVFVKCYLNIKMARHCNDVGVGCRRDFNVVMTTYLDVLIKSVIVWLWMWLQRRKPDVVPTSRREIVDVDDITSYWCRNNNVRITSRFYVPTTPTRRRRNAAGLGRRPDFNVMTTLCFDALTPSSPLQCWVPYNVDDSTLYWHRIWSSTRLQTLFLRRGLISSQRRRHDVLRRRIMMVNFIVVTYLQRRRPDVVTAD